MVLKTICRYGKLEGLLRGKFSYSIVADRINKSCKKKHPITPLDINHSIHSEKIEVERFFSCNIALNHFTGCQGRFDTYLTIVPLACESLER